MPEQLTPRQFHGAAGTGDWTVLRTGACAAFRTGSFTRGVELVQAIARVADAANHHPDVDLRYATVIVRLWSHDVDGLSERDVGMARSVSDEARRLGVDADPGVVQGVQIAVDAVDVAAIEPFWRAVLGYRQRGAGDLVDRAGRGPAVWFRQVEERVEEPRPRRNRVHVDVAVPADVAPSRVAAALEAGGVLVSDAHAPTWWTLADPEGNEVEVAVVAAPA